MTVVVLLRQFLRKLSGARTTTNNSNTYRKRYRNGTADKRGHGGDHDSKDDDDHLPLDHGRTASTTMHMFQD